MYRSSRKRPPRTTIIMIQLAHSSVRSIVLPRQMMMQQEAKTTYPQMITVPLSGAPGILPSCNAARAVAVPRAQPGIARSMNPMMVKNQPQNALPGASRMKPTVMGSPVYRVYRHISRFR